MSILSSIIKSLIQSRVKSPADLALFKRKTAKKYKIPELSNVLLLKSYHKLVKEQKIKRSCLIENLLRTRPIRSLSGIVNVSVLTKPYACPGKCLYCPTEKGIPKSYVSGEPAVERAKKLNYDPYLQVKKRLEMLGNQGHPTDKIELRIVGGTWSFYPKRYQNWFVRRCFQAANEFDKPRNSKFKMQNAKSQCKIQNLESLQRRNEKAKHRIVGLSIETRPDFINLAEIKQLRDFGVTMVELGVQSIYDDVLKLNLRGHSVKETISATRHLKDAGFKVLYQMMPNLAGSNLQKDEKMFEELFSEPDFQPDLLKIYPCALLKEAPLYKLWKQRKYKPYTENQLIELFKAIKKKIPYYVRIQRIARDIPSQRIIAGPAKVSNLRQVLAEISKKEGWKCKCIRCREVRENHPPSLRASTSVLRTSVDKSADKVTQKLKLFREDYDTSGGKEIFLSLESLDRRKLYSLLRLRIPSYIHSSRLTSETRHQYTNETPMTRISNEKCSGSIFSVLKNAAIIREVHTYGQLHPIYPPTLSKGRGINYRGDTPVISPQHRGLGKKLIKEAEKIVYTEFNRSAKKEFNLKKIAVIAGAGARDYFRKLGYKLKDTYMVKGI